MSLQKGKICTSLKHIQDGKAQKHFWMVVLKVKFSGPECLWLLTAAKQKNQTQQQN